MGVNVVELASGEKLIDLSEDTVTSETMDEGTTAHDASGNPIIGTRPKTAVLYTLQTLTEEQKAQARANIGAAEAETPREKAEITISYTKDTVINKSGEAVTLSGCGSRYTNLIPVTEGDRFSYIGTALNANYPNAIWFDENENVLSTEYWGDKRTGCLLVTVPAGVAFVRFCDTTYYSYETLDDFTESQKLKFEVLHMARENEEREVVITERVGGYYGPDMSWGAVETMSAKRTDPIPVVDGDTFYFTGTDANKSQAIWYDANGARLEMVYGTGSQLTLTPPSGAVLVRFIAYQYSTNLNLCTLIVSYKTEDKTLEYLQRMNYLYGKKYVACGDSFTAGDFAEKTDETWDEATQEYKTYCWHIANRNRMTLVNEAVSGTTMYNNGDSSFSVTRYTEVPTDADYITLCFGLNDQTSGGTIGTLDDTTNETVIGAWNVVLEYLITNMPYAKIGIIIADAYMNSTMRDAIVSVAKYWGVPYLDLKGDPSVPMLIGGRFIDVAVSSKAVALRNAAFQVSDTDSHPNAKAHEYRSTIIENFMRSL